MTGKWSSMEGVQYRSAKVNGKNLKADEKIHEKGTVQLSYLCNFDYPNYYTKPTCPENTGCAKSSCGFI